MRLVDCVAWSLDSPLHKSIKNIVRELEKHENWSAELDITIFHSELTTDCHSYYIPTHNNSNNDQLNHYIINKETDLPVGSVDHRLPQAKASSRPPSYIINCQKKQTKKQQVRKLDF